MCATSEFTPQMVEKNELYCDTVDAAPYLPILGIFLDGLLPTKVMVVHHVWRLCGRAINVIVVYWLRGAAPEAQHPKMCVDTCLATWPVTTTQSTRVLWTH